MPIPIRCQCGKTLNAPDGAAGKAVKCPGCATTLRVPAASSQSAASGKRPNGPTKPPAKPVSKPAVARSASAPVTSSTKTTPTGLSDLFDEEGFEHNRSAVCPACRKDIKPGAVLCTQCGYHLEKGVRLTAHETPGVDVSTGTLALRKAASDMQHAKKLQDDLVAGAGMPTWMLALILTVLTGLTVIGILAINYSRQAEQDGTDNTFNALQIFCLFSGCCFAAVAVAAYFKIAWNAYKEEPVTGIMTAFVPFYIFYYVFKNRAENLKPLIAVILLGAIAGGFFYGAQNF